MIQINNAENYSSEKILNKEALLSIISELKKQNKKSGLCVGGYDLLHPGHMTHLRSAKKLCNVLIVGVTSDEFVNKRKTYTGPVYPDFIRAFSIAQLKCVDYVIISRYKTAVELIELIKPDYYIKGPDYKTKSTPGITAERRKIKEIGGEIKYTDDEKLSTSEIINYIKYLK
ncbi:adenylyltransferase/cytidyltransferase family protein [Candidatus Woesearchaeota archaeon]|nr:adenylyltransferase/cytidyltransferase family protein [Candidatus Woesearchaeota archaeon]